LVWEKIGFFLIEFGFDSGVFLIIVYELLVIDRMGGLVIDRFIAKLFWILHEVLLKVSCRGFGKPLNEIRKRGEGAFFILNEISQQISFGILGCGLRKVIKRMIKVIIAHVEAME